MSKPSKDLTKKEMEDIALYYTYKLHYIKMGIATQTAIARVKHGEEYKDKEHFKNVLKSEIGELYKEYWEMVNIVDENDINKTEIKLMRCIEEAMDCLAVIRKWREQNEG